MHETPYLSSAQDIWSIGIVFINLLTGRDPWNYPGLTDLDFSCFVSYPCQFLICIFLLSSVTISVLHHMLELNMKIQSDFRVSGIQDVFYHCGFHDTEDLLTNKEKVHLNSMYAFGVKFDGSIATYCPRGYTHVLCNS